VYSLRENISDPNLCFPAPLEELVDIVNRRHVHPGSESGAAPINEPLLGP
jgi:hypothetical protein